jgi:hypothetical protein
VTHKDGDEDEAIKTGREQKGRGRQGADGAHLEVGIVGRSEGTAFQRSRCHQTSGLSQLTKMATRMRPSRLEGNRREGGRWGADGAHNEVGVVDGSEGAVCQRSNCHRTSGLS